MDTDKLALLQELNFTEYEAKAYLALLQKSPLSGYAVALNSGVPRSKIYEVLNGMEERGDVFVSREATALYSPLPPKELIAQRKRHAEACFGMAERALKEYSETSRNRENIWNICGYETILSCGKEIIGRTKKRVLLEVCPEEAEYLKDDLKAAYDRGVEIIIVAYGTLRLDFARIYPHNSIDEIRKEYGGRWMILSADYQEVLAGIVSSGPQSRAVTTTHPGLVMPITEEIVHDLYILEMMKKHRTTLEASFGPNLKTLRDQFNFGPSPVRQWFNEK